MKVKCYLAAKINP